MCHKGGRSAVVPAKDSLSSPPLGTLATVRVYSRSLRSAGNIRWWVGTILILPAPRCPR